MNKNKFFRRALALILSIVMILEMTPVSAFVKEEQPNTPPEVVEIPETVETPEVVEPPEVASSADDTISIMPIADADDLVTTINDFNGISGGTGQIMATKTGNIVTVTGSLTDVTSALELAIDAGVKVLWEATLTGAGDGDELLSVSGKGEFEITDGGILTSSGRRTLRCKDDWITITVSGTAKVTNTYNDGITMLVMSNIKVGEDAEITATGGTTIYSSEDSNITINGGTITAKDSCIEARGGNSNIIVSGTSKLTSSLRTIVSAGDIKVEGDAQVSTTGDCAIYSGSVNSNITINGGMITGKEKAIYAGGSQATVNVTGGVLFAESSPVSSVVYMPNNLAGFTGATGTGMIIGWDKAAGNTSYQETSKEDLVTDPSSAIVYWCDMGGPGISYKNGVNEGFIPVTGVTIPKTTLEQNDLTYTIPQYHIYTGTPQGIGAVTHSNSGVVNSITGGIVTVKYNGSTTVPTNAGTYAMTAEISGGTEYTAVEISLGEYEIQKAIPASPVKPYVGSITYGQPLSAVTLTGGSSTGTWAWKNPTLIPAVLDNMHELVFTPTDAINYDWTGIALEHQEPVTINKGTCNPLNQEYAVVKNKQHSYYYDLDRFFPDTSGLNFGTLTYEVVSVNNADGVLLVPPTQGALISPLEMNVASVPTAQKSAYIIIEVSSDNYNKFQFTLRIRTVDKEAVTVSAQVNEKAYDGEPITYSRVKVNSDVDNAIINGIELKASYMSTDGGGYNHTVAPTNAGRYVLRLEVPASNPDYIGNGSVYFTIEKKPVTVRVRDIDVKVGEAIPPVVIDYIGFIGVDDIFRPLSTMAAVKFTTDTSTVKAATFPLLFTTNAKLNIINGANYTLIHQDGILRVTNYSSGGGALPTVVPNNVVTIPTTATQTLKNKPDKNGKLTMTITKKMVEQGIDQAKQKWQGHEKNGISLVVNNSSVIKKSFNAVIESAALDHLVSQGIKTITIQCGNYRITLDEKAIKSLKTQSSGKVTASVTPYKVSGTAAKTIGSRPVFDIKFKDSKGKVISNFGEGTITRGIKYTPTAKEMAGNLFIVKVVKQKPQWINKSSYSNGWMLWSGNSCSVYGVGYKKAATYTDTAKHWAKDSIDFVYSRGLLTSTKKTTFKPNAAITRADFLMALGKLAGADVSIYKTSSFIDVTDKSAAMPYIEWAVANKIIQGIGNNQFGPTEPITREHMALILSNYAKACDITLPVSREYPTFADASKITSEFKDAVRAIVQTGVLVGKDDSKFDPQGKVTRAEAAAILHRFVVLIIDEGTSRGWVRNDSGTLIYIDSQGRIQTTDGNVKNE